MVEFAVKNMFKHNADILTPQDYGTFSRLVAEIEQSTAIKVSIVALPASDKYREFVLMYGFVAGTALGLLLWQTGFFSDLPFFVTIQLAVMLACDAIPALRRALVDLVPDKILKRRASRMAFHQYHAHHSNNAKAEPYVTLFVSLAERYVHVITNPVLHQRIPGNWETVTNQFAVTMRASGIAAAATEALTTIGKILRT